MSRVLITGIDGFVGRYLADYCISKGDDVYGIAKTPKADVKDVRMHICDVRDADAVTKVIFRVKPEKVYHLAAITFIPKTAKNPKLTYDTNFYGSLNLYEAIKKSGLNPKILFVGTSEVYGEVDEKDLPIKEDAPLNPLNPYAVSKAAADILSGYYSTQGIMIVRVRPFNHTGPGQAPSFVCSDFAYQIAEIEKGMREAIIKVGNLDIKRDFTDVRDVVRAYWMLMDNDMIRSGEIYNICSSRAILIQEILDFLLSKAKIKIKVIRDTNKSRSSDLRVSYGDNSKIKRVVGWEPKISIKKTLEDILKHWRGSLLFIFFHIETLGGCKFCSIANYNSLFL